MEPVISVAGMVALLGALAFLVEAMVEIAVGSWLKKVLPGDEKIETRAVILGLAASAVGVVVALMYNLDLPGVVAQTFGVSATLPAAAPIIGAVLTGILMGRGAQWFHDIGVMWMGLDRATASANRTEQGS